MILTDTKKIKYYTDMGVWANETLVDVFQKNVKDYPERIALADPLNKEQLVGSPAERISYADLGERVDILATKLLARGFKKDDIVIVQLPNIWELTLIYMALARIGAIFSPLPMQWREKEFNYICDLSQSVSYISVKNFAGFDHIDMVKKVAKDHPSLKDIITLDELKKMSEGEADVAQLNAIEIGSNDIFSLCWSSGTESNSKGCPMSHNNWLAQVKVMTKAVGVWNDRCQVILCTAPMVNMTGVGIGLVNWLFSGGTTVFHHPFDGEVFFKQMATENITTTLLVPALLNMILKHPQVSELNLSTVEKIMTGSAPPSAWSLEEFKKRWGIDVGCGWGQTEGTAIMSGAEDIPDAAKRSRFYPNWSIRRSESPVEGIEIKVVDLDSGKALTKVGDIGQLAYKGPNVFPGYFRRPDLSETSFDSDGYFYTGDLFRVEDDGYVSFFDRCKDIIIRGGNNISAQEIENMLQAHPKVLDAAAVAMPDERLGERICVYIVLAEGVESLALSELTDFMRDQNIAIYKLPERLEITDVIPRNPVGKIVKPQLREDIAKKLKAEGVKL
ncbi:MAG: acyl--CoA ligase [Pseudomonadales bacterium]|nr:acyl--CoA ligase [Pseudomonadales bacterium]